MFQPRAAEVVKRRLALASRRLGTADPVGTFGPLFDRSFELPLGDPRYGNNRLTPGAIPLEHSFSETAAGSLRFALEPYPGATAQTRQQEVSRELRTLIHQQYGQKALHWFDSRSEAWRGSFARAPKGFGAWAGASFDESGPEVLKAYYEMRPDDIDALPPNLQYASRLAMANLPGLVPIFCSVAAGRTAGAQRVYFFHRGDLRLLDLEPLMNQLGIGHQLPSLLLALGVILGGQFVLPEGSVVMGLRDTSKGMELKLEVLVPGLTGGAPREMHGLMQMFLNERPESQRALNQWVRAMTPDDATSPGDISVLSARVNPTQASRLAVYLRPTGYDRPRTPADRPGRSNDPYATVG
jgi:hypothetical protein